MKIALVHLSDIHFKSKQDIAFKRLDKLANAIQFARTTDETLLFAITGDVANSGSAIEYNVARDFFGPLFNGLGVDAYAPGQASFIPGNHDCDFRSVGDLRPRILADIEKQIDTLDPAGETSIALLQVESNFFEFLAELTGERLQPREQIYRSRTLTAGRRKIEFRLFNSAWLSQRHDEPGKLGFPNRSVEEASATTDADLVISLVHHPANWLNPSVYQAFRKAIQETSDLLLTGHEHTLGGQTISPFDGSELIHFESGPLQPPNSGASEFSIIHIDLETRTWRKEDYRWSEGAYNKLRDGMPQSLFDKSGRSSTLQVSSRFLARLTDPGTGFLHPRQQNLKLSDIYTYPDLRVRTLSRKLRGTTDLPEKISSKDVAKTLLASKNTVIAGASDSGKTALLKMLYFAAATSKGRTALLLNGKDLKGEDPQRAIKAQIETAIKDQYGLESLGRFCALEKSQRVLLIDDWDEVRFNRAGRKALLDAAESQFGGILIAVDDIFLIDEIAGRHESMPLDGFSIADIREFGFRLRGDMARKWHALGSTFIEDEQAFSRHVAASINAIDTILGRNLLPSYPVNILTLLQTYDAGGGSQSSELGSYGQVYEALITARLAKVSIKSVDIGTKITFLSRVAWNLFDNRKTSLSEKDWAKICEQYQTDYGIRLDPSELQSACMAANIITADNLGIRFSYGYGYCYFSAKYFQENLADLQPGASRDDLFNRLKELSELVYNQGNANIVIFYIFLTKDRLLINHVIKNAEAIFSTFSEFDFKTHVQFLNNKLGAVPTIELPANSHTSNQQKYEEHRDERGEQLEPEGEVPNRDVRYNESLAIQYKLVIALRYLMLMGQILRNFPGSLKTETKLELAFESYSLGLRILGAVFEISRSEAEMLARDIAKILQSKMAFTGSESEMRQKAEEIMVDMLRQITFGLMKRISHAIGLRELELTYDEVAELRDNNLSNRMIRLSIELDHFEEFPKDQIEELADELKKNSFSFQTLRDLVMNHLYLFPRDYNVQQWCGSKLQMKVNSAEVRGSAMKLSS